MRKIEIGVLVAFATVDHGIEIMEASGTRTTNQADRLFDKYTYRPYPGEKGLVVGGPEVSQSQVKLWQVYVGGSNWWFPEDHIVGV